MNKLEDISKKLIDISKKLIDKYGDLQLIVAIEELSELQKELCKYLRNKPNIDNITEEIADVIIMINQLLIFFNITDIQYAIDLKLKRTEDRLL